MDPRNVRLLKQGETAIYADGLIIRHAGFLPTHVFTYLKRNIKQHNKKQGAKWAKFHNTNNSEKIFAVKLN